jgi:bacillithiol biosynthesis cysteine-adding enzyme BshC
MRIESIQLAHANKLANDYIHGTNDVHRRYDGMAQDESAWRSRLAYMENRPLGADRDRLAETLLAYNRRIGNSPAAIEHIEKLRSRDSLVVVGGQQAGLFSGPMLVIYKAITIIRQAREASLRYGRPVIPVFWIAGEDHDFAEVDHIELLSEETSVKRLQLPKRVDERVSISHLNITQEEWEQALRGLVAELPDTERKAEYISKLRAICSESDNLSDAFARIMAWLFKDEGLVLIDSADPEIRLLQSPMWRLLIERNERLGEAYQEAAGRLLELGYTPQAEVHRDGANLFYYHKGARLLLYRDGDQFADRHREVRLSRDELLALCEQHPASLSNNVLTRPLMQDYLLPVLAVVLGPGEIAYWGQLKEAFHCLGMRMPVIVPRAGYTLLEPVDQKLLVKHGLSAEQALKEHELDRRRDAWLSAQETFDAEAEFAHVEQAIRQVYEPLIERAGTVNAVMQELGRSNLTRIIDQVHYYRNRIRKEIAAKHAVGLRQFERLKLSLLPDGVPQERVYNVFSYLNRYGDGWLRYLLHEHREDAFDYRRHYIVYL